MRMVSESICSGTYKKFVLTEEEFIEKVTKIYKKYEKFGTQIKLNIGPHNDVIAFIVKEKQLAPRFHFYDANSEFF